MHNKHAWLFACLSLRCYGPKGFTLIELLVVIAIIGLLSGLSVVSVNYARGRALATKRLADMRQIQQALEMYFNNYGSYPLSDTDGCGGWDIGNKNYQLLTNRINEFMPKAPNDPAATTNCSGYAYYRYPAGSYGCPAASGAYYVLGIRGTGQTYANSPGWQCSGRNWSAEFEWVRGSFEQ
jgi:prepilin-type N-terminal cleavage/methylation domain-containing protein